MVPVFNPAQGPPAPLGAAEGFLAKIDLSGFLFLSFRQHVFLTYNSGTYFWSTLR